ncbi:hypothetical protein [Streptosporangium sp. NPDC002721]|uniref:hypothetical protein n=1 Tax=Streptosporangium sp. NPDC002721 TaxID=3366188 RepID=UPI0036AAA3A3
MIAVYDQGRRWRNGLSQGDIKRRRDRIVSALKTLSHPRCPLVSLPHIGDAIGRYREFQLLHESGESKGSPIAYTVPAEEDDYFRLPMGLFRNGWIHVLKDSELIFLMMLASSRADPVSGQTGYTKFESSQRVLQFGVGPDAYEAHGDLESFGLIKVLRGDDRRDNGTVRGYRDNPNVVLPLHMFRLVDDGFNKSATSIIINAQERLSKKDLEAAMMSQFIERLKGILKEVKK